jgi:hypothetical protein
MTAALVGQRKRVGHGVSLGEAFRVWAAGLTLSGG